MNIPLLFQSVVRRPHFLLLITVLSLSATRSARADEDTPLEICMQHMGKAFKELAKDLKQPVEADKDKYVQLSTTIKDESVKAHDLVPKMADGLPADQKDAMIKGYQKDMGQFDVDVDSLTQALKDGKWDEANKLLATLKTEMVAGHKAYRKKE